MELLVIYLVSYAVHEVSNTFLIKLHILLHHFSSVELSVCRNMIEIYLIQV
jgi:hypothetical protein